MATTRKTRQTKSRTKGNAATTNPKKKTANKRGRKGRALPLRNIVNEKHDGKNRGGNNREIKNDKRKDNVVVSQS